MPTEGSGNILTALGSPFFFRYITPALFVSWALIPLVPEPWTHLAYIQAIGVYVRLPVLTLSRLLEFLLGLFSIGFILRGLFPIHTGVLMGILLPQRPREWAISRLERHLQEAQTILAGATPALRPTSRQYWEAVRARDFIDQLPQLFNLQTKTFDPVIRAPTMYGNVLTALAIDVGRRQNLRAQIQAQQTQPQPRWLGKQINAMVEAEAPLRGDERDEYAQATAVAEAALPCSLGFTLLVPVYLWAALWSWVGHTPAAAGDIAMVVICAALAYMAYRVCVYEIRVSTDMLRVFLSQRPL